MNSSEQTRSRMKVRDLRSIGVSLFVCIVCLPVLLGLGSHSVRASEPVLVEIFELPEGQVWPETTDTPTEEFQSDVMAFPVLPRRYSQEGLIVDRQAAFVLRLTATATLPAGDHEFLLRALNRARLLIDGHEVGSTEFTLKENTGHNEVPKMAQIVPNLRMVAPGHDEQLLSFRTTGQPHTFIVEAIIGGKQRRPESGELTLSYRPTGTSDALFLVMTPLAPGDNGGNRFELTDAKWEAFAESEMRRIVRVNRQRRGAADQRQAYWSGRHRRAREFINDRLGPLREINEGPDRTAIDQFVRETLDSDTPWPLLVDDYTFLRRLALDTVGVVPTREEIDVFLADPVAQRRSAAIGRYLADDRWADHWVSYWQDVLAENPGILKPKLNNTGPFRWWVYESFLDNKPIDRFVTELILMRGSRFAGGPAGFSMATQNDVPMAAKAHVLGQAFLGVQMKCARCHDSPQNDLRQEQLFNLAAMLGRQPLKVPDSSSILVSEHELANMAVEVSLRPGSEVQPLWPFEQLAYGDRELPAGIVEDESDTREKLAAHITSYTNERFAQVIVNRLWQRYMGQGIVDSVDDWENAECHSPPLLDYLAQQLISNGYDLKHVANLIFSSRTYQISIIEGANGSPLFPRRRRQTAEQIVDSLFTISGKSLKSEPLNLDVDSQRSIDTFLNLGVPRRAWEFTSLSNERDRPALAMPHAQSIVDLLSTFGWRDSRQDPLTSRDNEPTVQQPGIFANGVVVQRTTCLSDDNGLTELCQSTTALDQLIEDLFLQVLSRPPRRDEADRVAAMLEDGFGTRLTGVEPSPVQTRRHAVSWSNHLNEEATRIKLELERQVQAGDPPSVTLHQDWRERAEDVIWALVNSPEFIFTP